MWTWIKAHPYIAGLAALSIVILLWVVTRTGSTQVVQGATGPSDALQAAQLAAQVHASDAQAATNQQQTEINAALAAKQIDANTALAVAQAQRDALDRQTVGSETIAQRQVDAATAVANAQRDANEAQTAAAKDIAAQQAGVQTAGINAGVQIAGIQSQVQLANISAQLAAVKSTNDTALGINADNNVTTRFGLAASKEVDLQQLADGLILGLDNNQTAIRITQSNNDTKTVIDAQDNSSADFIASLAASLGITQSNNNTKVSLAGIQGTVDIAGLQAGVQNNFIAANLQLGQGALDLAWHNTDVNAALFSNQQNMDFALKQNILQQIDFQGLNKSSSIEALSLITFQPSVAIASIQGSAATDWGSNLIKTLPALGSDLASFGVASILHG